MISARKLIISTLGATFLIGTLAVSTWAADRTKTGAADFVQKRLEDGFKLLDANRDGKVDRKEFSRITTIAPKMKNNPDGADYIFGVLDKNGDEKLIFEEYKGIVLIQAMAAQAQKDGTALPQISAAKPANTTASSTAPQKPLTQAETEFFEKKIRPVLADKCYKCHSAEADKVKGGLLVDTRDGIRNSGDTGHAIVPGDVKSSLLLKAIRYEDSDLAMPPKKEGGKLSAEVIANFEKWVAMGAPDPREGKSATTASVNLQKGRDHWAFQLPKRVPAPQPKNASWARSNIDKFILADLEAKQLKPVGDASKATLLRRVCFDLAGLPPSPEEMTAFLNDKDPKAFEKVVDRLLASAQFGERWGRHWLDVARYAESSGKEVNIVYPHAWRYRDWVIGAFNQDKPYDRFLKEQLAGDLLPSKNDNEKAEHLVATGLLAIGPKSHNSRDFRQFQLDVADEQIDAVSQGMLGLTVACARCHDHKFDPVPQADYYAMAGIFLSTETRFGTPRFVQNNQTAPLIMLPEKAEATDAPPPTPQQMEFMKRQLETAKKERDEVTAEAKGGKDRQVFANPKFLRSQAQIAILEKILGRNDENGKPLHFAMGVQDKMLPRDAQLLQRGELDKPQDTIPRGFVQVLAPAEKARPQISQGSGRLELADWIASPENPLTARVMANRVWLWIFDKGLVPTPDNFGTTGQKPTNQALLDALAISFVEQGWSVKQLVKQIVMSHTYQLASDYHEANYAADPENNLHWRMSKRRLDAEAIRDAMLAVAGKLDLTPPKGSPVANTEGPAQQLIRPLPGLGGGGPGARFRGMGGGESANVLNADRNFRSVYLPIVRDHVPDSLAVFDFAESSLVVGNREDTTVPSQALYLMNSGTVQKLAEAMVARLAGTKATGTELAKKAFELAYSRPPTQQELEATTFFFTRFNEAEAKNYPDKTKLGFAAMTAFCQALLGSAEFRYLN